MGTEWPIFALLHSYDWSYPGIPQGNDYDCLEANRTLDWPSLLKSLQAAKWTKEKQINEIRLYIRDISIIVCTVYMFMHILCIMSFAYILSA